MKTLCLIDTETTSADPSTGRLVEVGLVLWSVPHRSIIRARSWLVEGETNEAEAVNGIPAALLTHGVPREEVERQVHNIALKEADAFVAYNAEFDRAWFGDEVQRVRPWLCAMDDFDWPRPTSSKSLTAVALAHGVGVVDAHRALPDCLTMARLFERVAESLDAANGDWVGKAERPPAGQTFESWLARAARPRALFEVANPNRDKAAAEAQGFRWKKDEATGRWLGMRRRLAVEDAGKLPFRVQRVRA